MRGVAPTGLTLVGATPLTGAGRSFAEPNFPADEALREQGYERLLPPFVPELRKRIKEWRDKGYEGASATSKALLNWWFKQEHLVYGGDGNTFLFQYYFAQREAVKTVIWLYDAAGVRNK